MTPMEQQAQHLVRMAADPGWAAYAKQRAQELANDSSGLFNGLGERIAELRRQQKDGE